MRPMDLIALVAFLHVSFSVVCHCSVFVLNKPKITTSFSYFNDGTVKRELLYVRCLGKSGYEQHNLCLFSITS